MYARVRFLELLAPLEEFVELLFLKLETAVHEVNPSQVFLFPDWFPTSEEEKTCILHQLSTKIYGDHVRTFQISVLDYYNVHTVHGTIRSIPLWFRFKVVHVLSQTVESLKRILSIIVQPRWILLICVFFL